MEIAEPGPPPLKPQGDDGFGFVDEIAQNKPSPETQLLQVIADRLAEESKHRTEMLEILKSIQKHGRSTSKSSSLLVLWLVLIPIGLLAVYMIVVVLAELI
jgi:hypothetical protein